MIRESTFPGKEPAQRSFVPVPWLAAALLCLTVLEVLPLQGVRAQGSGPTITLPAANQAVTGEVIITGSTGAAIFASAELAFAYGADTTNTWFTIASLSQPVTDGTLATWDTTRITDGSYVLRLRVFAADGAFQDATVPFEIANYTSPEVASPAPSPTKAPAVQIPSPVLVPTSPSPQPSLVPTPSPLPPNPMALTPNSVYAGLVRGALVTVVVIVIFAAILLRRHS